MKLSTKEKGDIGLTKVIARLTELLWHVNLPIAEHLHYDCIAEKNGAMKRIQVKYCAIKKGCINIGLRSIWSNKNGSHVNKFDSNNFDILAVYCPDNDNVYFVASDEVKVDTLRLRVAPALTNDAKIRFAKDYETFPWKGGEDGESR